MMEGRVPPSYSLLILAAAHVQDPEAAKMMFKPVKKQQQGLVGRTSLTEQLLRGNTGSGANTEATHFKSFNSLWSP